MFVLYIYKQLDINGCTGNLNFTKDGKRNDTYLQMIALEGLVDGAVSQ